MAPSRSATNSAKPAAAATVFAALGDPTRLALVSQLCDGSQHSIAQLTAGRKLTRQAISKHLRVLEQARVVLSVRSGRENLFVLNPKSMTGIQSYIEQVSQQWDRSLARLKAFVEH